MIGGSSSEVTGWPLKSRAQIKKTQAPIAFFIIPIGLAFWSMMLYVT
jgi:hypothetical protein